MTSLYDQNFPTGYTSYKRLFYDVHMTSLYDRKFSHSPDSRLTSLRCRKLVISGQTRHTSYHKTSLRRLNDVFIWPKIFPLVIRRINDRTLRQSKWRLYMNKIFPLVTRRINDPPPRHSTSQVDRGCRWGVQNLTLSYCARRTSYKSTLSYCTLLKTFKCIPCCNIAWPRIYPLVSVSLIGGVWADKQKKKKNFQGPRTSAWIAGLSYYDYGYVTLW